MRFSISILVSTFLAGGGDSLTLGPTWTASHTSTTGLNRRANGAAYTLQLTSLVSQGSNPYHMLWALPVGIESDNAVDQNQRFNLLFDTGGRGVWVMSNDIQQCFQDRDPSTLYQSPSADAGWLNSKERKVYGLGTARVDLLQTTLTVGDEQARQLSQFQLGAAYSLKGMFLSAPRTMIGDGMFGMDPLTAEIFQRKLGLGTTQFLLSVDDGSQGTLSFGDWTAADPAFHFVDVVSSSSEPYWVVTVDNVGATLVDSGAPLITMPTQNVEDYFRQIDTAYWSTVRDPSQQNSPVFYALDCAATSTRFPNANLEIRMSGNDVGLAVDALVGQPLTQAQKGTAEVARWCLSKLQPNTAVAAPDVGAVATLGLAWFKNYDVVFNTPDDGKYQVGVRKKSA